MWCKECQCELGEGACLRCLSEDADFDEAIKKIKNKRAKKENQD